MPKSKTPKKPVAKPEATVAILAKALEGRASLEHYSDERGTIVALRGNKEIFWVDFYELKKIVEDFTEIVKLRIKK